MLHQSIELPGKFGTGKLVTYTEGKRIERTAKKSTRQANKVYSELVAAAEELLALVKKRRGNTNKDNSRLTSQIRSLIQKWK